MIQISASIRDKRYDQRDGGKHGIRGLILRTMPSGLRVWYYVAKRGARWQKIGLAPAVTLGMARSAAQGFVRAALEGPEIVATSLTVEQYVEWIYGPDFEAHHASAKHLDNLHPFNALKLDEITDSVIRAWRTRRARDVAPATINRNLAALKALLRFAVGRGDLPAHPLTDLPRLKITEEHRVRYLSPDEEERLREALKGRVIEARVLVALNTGLRWSEQARLRWSDITDGIVTVRAAHSKSSRSRRVPLNAEARSVIGSLALAAYLTGAHSRVVFGNKDIRKPWAAALDVASVEDFRWHDLRHHFASQLVIHGRPLNTVRELLGHSDLKLTMRYAHLSPGHLIDAVEWR